MKFPEIIYEDEFFLALNKPSGLLSVPDREQTEPSLKDLLLKKYQKIFTVHRLDRPTSGIIAFAKDESTHKYLSGIFEDRKVLKIYNGLIHGSPSSATGTIDMPMMEHPSKNGTMVTNRKGKSALTDYETLEKFGRYSWMQFRIHTGRTHQIRVHMKHLGNPILCDELYSNGKPLLLSSIKKNFKLSKSAEEETPLLNRLALHSAKLSFLDQKGNQHQLEAPLPKDLRAVLQQLRKWA